MRIIKIFLLLFCISCSTPNKYRVPDDVRHVVPCMYDTLYLHDYELLGWRTLECKTCGVCGENECTTFKECTTYTVTKKQTQ